MRMNRIFVAATRITALSLIAAGRGPGQQVLTAKAGLIYIVRGHVSIAGRGPLTIGAAKPRLNAGETLFSEAGHAEVLLNSGGVLRIGDFTRIRMDSVELTDTRVSIEGGSAVVTVNELPKPDHIEIHMGGAVVVMKSEGVYRFDDGETAGPRLRVFSGQAEVHREDNRHVTIAKYGQVIDLRNLQLARFDRKEADELQQWAAKRNGPPPFTTLAPMICYSRETNGSFLLPGNDQTQRGTAQPISNAEGLRDWIEECLHR